MQHDRDAGRTLDDVVVGDDVAVCGVDDAGAGARQLLNGLGLAVPAAVVGEVEPAEIPAVVAAGGDGLVVVDADHAVLHGRHNVRNLVGEGRKRRGRPAGNGLRLLGGRGGRGGLRRGGDLAAELRLLAVHALYNDDAEQAAQDQHHQRNGNNHNGIAAAAIAVSSAGKIIGIV